MERATKRKPPEGYKYIAPNRIQNQDKQHTVFLTNRDLDEVNHALRGFPQRIIKHFVAEKDSHVQVVDVGGGWQSRAAKELAEEYLGNVVVYNVDFMAEPDDFLPNLHPIPESAGDLPLSDESIDVVYSHMMIPYFSSPGYTATPVTALDALSEMSRVLVPGGVGVTNDPFYEQYSEWDENWTDLGEVIGARVSRKDGGIFLDPKRRVERLLENPLRPVHQILIFQKEPVDPFVDEIVTSVPDKLSRWRTI